MAGRQIKPSKGAGELYDAGRGLVCAERIQPLPNNLKKKISLILEAIPSKSKSEIAEVLQSCDYDVDTALNCFIADDEMDEQNEWKVQGKRKNKKKRKPSGKKAPKDDAQSQDGTENSSVTDPKLDEKPEEGQEKISQNIPTEVAPKEQPTVVKDKPATTKDKPATTNDKPATTNDKPATTNNNKPATTNNDKPATTNNDKPATTNKDKPATTNKDKPATTNKDKLKLLENLKPLSSVSTPLETTPTPTSPSLSSPLLSPTDSVNSSQDSQTLNKNRAGNSANEKHPRVRTTSGSGSEVIKKSFKDLQRSSVSIARYQSMLDEQAESTTKTLAKSFQAIRQALDEREKYLKEELESVIEEAKKLLEERQRDASHLSFKCNRVGSMTDEETTELRSEIKNFVGERRIDEDLGKTIRFQREEEKILEVVKNFGEVPPIKQRYTPYKRKEPSKAVSGKPPAVKATTASTNVSTTTSTTTTTTSSSKETKSSNSRNEKRPVLSPSRLKDQAEMHAKLQQAVKEQQVTPTSKESNKQADRNANEKSKPRDFGPKSARNNNSRGQQSNNAHREQNPQRQRQTSASQNSKKFTGNRNENKSTNSEKSKNGAQANGGTKAQDTEPADGVSETQDNAPAVNGVQAQGDNTADNGTQAQHDKSAESDQVMPANRGQQRNRRRYIRKTPPDDGSPIFRTGTVDTANTSSAKVNRLGKSNNDSKSPDLPKEQLENKTANGTNDFVPLPQRNRRPRKMFFKKDPNSKIEFPPNRENGSVSS